MRISLKFLKKSANIGRIRFRSNENRPMNAGVRQQ
jgi:hypothetical protein